MKCANTLRVLALWLLPIVLAGCTGTSPEATSTQLPSSTPRPTSTQAPTDTPRPTNTPRRTPTPTAVPQPILLQGSGDDVVDLEKWSGAALAHITYQGSRNFAVWNYGPDGERIDLLVNTIGPYEGTLPIDFMVDENTSRFQVESSGDWTIEVLPLAKTRRVTVPSMFEGMGDEVVVLDGSPDLLRIDASTARSNFAIWAYGNRRDLLVNEIAPYTGLVIAGSDTAILAIHAEGEWSIEVTSR